MPGLNETGPLGRGSMTGGGRGLCNENRSADKTQPSGGGGRGRRMGFNRGQKGNTGPGMRNRHRRGMCQRRAGFQDIRPEGTKEENPPA